MLGTAVPRKFLLEFCEATQTAVRKSMKAGAPLHESKDVFKWRFAARMKESPRCSYSKHPPIQSDFLAANDLHQKRGVKKTKSSSS